VSYFFKVVLTEPNYAQS